MTCSLMVAFARLALAGNRLAVCLPHGAEHSCAHPSRRAGIRCCSASSCISICQAIQVVWIAPPPAPTERAPLVLLPPRDALYATLAEATAECDAHGMRLCGTNELTSKCCKSGCGLDRRPVWAATPCAAGDSSGEPAPPAPPGLPRLSTAERKGLEEQLVLASGIYQQNPLAHSTSHSGSLQSREWIGQHRRSHTVLVSICNEAYLPLVDNWLCFLSRHRLKALVVAEDPTALHHLKWTPARACLGYSKGTAIPLYLPSLLGRHKTAGKEFRFWVRSRISLASRALMCPVCFPVASESQSRPSVPPRVGSRASTTCL